MYEEWIVNGMAFVCGIDARSRRKSMLDEKKINNKEIVDGSSLSLKANDNYTIAVTTTWNIFGTVDAIQCNQKHTYPIRERFYS